VGLAKKLTTERTESTEFSFTFLCELCVLRGEKLFLLLATPKKRFPEQATDQTW